MAAVLLSTFVNPINQATFLIHLYGPLATLGVVGYVLVIYAVLLRSGASRWERQAKELRDRAMRNIRLSSSITH